MKTDERDEALARLLEREISWLEPDSAGRLAAIWRRGTRRRTYRSTAAVTAVAVFVGVVTMAGFYVHEHRPPTAEDVSGWPTYQNGSSGWTMRYPESWQVTDLDACRAYFDGAIVVNFPDTYQPPHPGACPDGFSDLPDTGVAIELQRPLRGPPFEPEIKQTGPPDTPLPLSLEDMTPGPPPSPAHGSASPGTFYGQAVWAAQRAYSLSVWIGPNASNSDREIARQIVASIMFASSSFIPAPTPTGVTSPVSDGPPVAHVVDTIQVGRATSVAYGLDSVWVAVDAASSSDRAILRIDAKSDLILATIHTPVVPGWVVGGGGLVVADGSVWVAGQDEAGGAVVRIDPSTNRVADTIRFDHGDVADVAVDGTTLWALIRGDPGQPEIARVDLLSDKVVATTTLGGGYGRYLFASDGYVVAALAQPPGGPFDDGTLVRIDSSTNQVVWTLHLGAYPSVALGDGTLWAITGGKFTQIDLDVGRPTGIQDDSACSGDALAAGGGGLWCFDPAHDRAVARYNPHSGKVDIAMSADANTGGSALVASTGSIWILRNKEVVRVDLG
jgi:hypothetical protein